MIRAPSGKHKQAAVLFLLYRVDRMWPQDGHCLSVDDTDTVTVEL